MGLFTIDSGRFTPPYITIVWNDTGTDEDRFGTKGDITIRLDIVDNPRGYVLTYNWATKGPGGTWVEGPITPNTTETFNMSLPGEYQFRLRATVPFGESVISNVLKATTM